MTEQLTLLQFLTRIAGVVNGAPQLTGQCVVAEVSDLRRSGGHFYLMLIEKDERGQTVASMRANLWNGTAQSLYRRYGEKMWEVFKNGNEVRLLCSVNYHQRYGISLIINNIDVNYRRDTTKIQAEILHALTAEGIVDKNKELIMPTPVQRIAVISAAGAAGYGDFINQLEHNRMGLRFYTHLYEASMQGVNVPSTVCRAIKAIEAKADMYDCIVIIRGGGATTDLAGFDDLGLARAVCLCKLPVIVGIGHERDNTVLDYIANLRMKTPTAAAEWIVGQGEQALSHVIELATQVAHLAQSRLIGDHRQLESIEQIIPVLARSRADAAAARLDRLASSLPLLVQGKIQNARSTLDRASRSVESAGQRALTMAVTRVDNYLPVIHQALRVALIRSHEQLDTLADKVRLLSPDGVLARGYSITLTPDGHALRSPEQAPAGTRLRTRLAKGVIESVATDTAV